MRRPSDITIRKVLDGTATARQAESVAKWFATEDGKAWLDDDMRQTADSFFAEKQLDKSVIPSDEMFRIINKKIESILLKRRRRRIAYRFAAIVVPCAVVVVLWLNLTKRIGGPLGGSLQYDNVVAVHGERKEIIFQDGTKVFLNAGTNIQYPKSFGISDRRISLNGEAYFEVSPNAHRPFIIDLTSAEIQVLGTSFSVRAYDYESSIDVILMEGKIDFADSNHRYELRPNQELIYDKTRHIGKIINGVHADKEALWRDNVIFFHDAPLEEVVSVLSRWYDVKFEIVDQVATYSTFSLKTKDIPLDELLEELSLISSLKFECNGNIVKISKK